MDPLGIALKCTLLYRFVTQKQKKNMFGLTFWILNIQIMFGKRVGSILLQMVASDDSILA